MFSRVELGATCSICLESVEAKRIIVVHPCSHFLHKKCFETWMRLNPELKCVYCRFPIQHDIELKINDQLINLPWKKLCQFSFTFDIIEKLISHTEYYSFQEQRSIVLLILLIQNIYQASLSCDGLELNEIKLMATRNLKHINFFLSDISLEVKKSLFEKIGILIYSISEQRQHLAADDFLSIALFSLSLFIRLGANKRHIYFAKTLLDALEANSSEFPHIGATKQLLLDTINTTIYLESFKKMRVMDNLQLMDYFKSFSSARFKAFEKLTDGYCVTSKKIQNTVFLIKLEKGIYSVLIAFGILSLVYAMSFYVDFKRNSGLR